MTDDTGGLSPEALVAVSRAVTTARLLSGLVHEVNNALLVISGTVEVLQTQSGLSQPVVNGLARVRRQTERTAAAITRVTAFTQAPLESRGEVKLTELAQAAVDLRRFAVTRAGLSLDFVAKDGASPRVRGNAGQLQQAILSLVLSAERAVATTRGRIVVEVGSDGGLATVAVTDNRPAAYRTGGQGVEPFPTGSAVTDLVQLGLFAARVIATAHGGTVTIEDGVDLTTARIRLPGAPGV
jgi:signal transduction histidine kinase